MISPKPEGQRATATADLAQFPVRLRLVFRELPSPLLRICVVTGFVLIVMGFAAYIEVLTIRPDPFAYQRPVFDSYHGFRTLATLLAGLGITVAAGNVFEPSIELRNSHMVWLLINLYTAIAAATLVISNIALFNRIAVEDGPVENATALLLFVASAVFGSTSWQLTKRAEKQRFAAALCICLGAGFFVLGMEEISWMQRIIGYKTPASLYRLNWQHEVNLHNTHTFVVECLYYSVSAFALVLLPALKPSFGEWPAFRPLLAFVPGPETALLTAPAFLFNFAHWDVMPVQLALWVTAGAVSLITLQQRRGIPSALSFLVLLGLLGGQAAVLWGGMSSSIMPDSTEYQEFWIALGYVCFSIGTRARLLD